MNERKPVKQYDYTVLVILFAAIVFAIRGVTQAAWALVWVWAAAMALIALSLGVVASLSLNKKGASAFLRFGAQGVAGRLILALWALLTALASIHLALQGHPVLVLVAVSLMVVVLPGTGTLIVDEYVQSLIARGAALAGGVGLAAAMLLAALRLPGLDVALGALSFYVGTLEVYVWRSLKS